MEYGKVVMDTRTENDKEKHGKSEKRLSCHNVNSKVN